MKQFTTTLICILCFHTACIACPQQIKAFYTAYLSNMLSDDSQNAALCRSYLTEELIDKVQRITYATGADPIIRAQDTNRDAIETLTVTSLTDNWYLVRYLWKKDDSGTLTEIPLKAQKIDGTCKITYITPIWNGSQYGDQLLTCNPATREIDQTSELGFLKSFYDAYTASYCNMPADLSDRLSALRSSHLSTRASEQFAHAEAGNNADGFVGYDLLIDGFDFDCLWRKSLEFAYENGNDYQVTCKAGNKAYKIIVTIKKSDNGYQIESLKLQTK